jgi:hypothetical protein
MQTISNQQSPMNETPEEYKKRHEKNANKQKRQIERQRAESDRLRNLSDEDLLFEHEENFLYSSKRMLTTRSMILSRMRKKA